MPVRDLPASTGLPKAPPAASCPAVRRRFDQAELDSFVPRKSPRNILFVMFDQLRFDYLSCAGHPSLETPHIDALAARGRAWNHPLGFVGLLVLLRVKPFVDVWRTAQITSRPSWRAGRACRCRSWPRASGPSYWLWRIA